MVEQLEYGGGETKIRSALSADQTMEDTRRSDIVFYPATPFVYETSAASYFKKAF